jgi:threonine/homoserine/homoserine lactone efflux protein
MDSFINNIITILMMNGLILIVPGVNFFLVLKYSLLNKFQTGFYCVMGITSAIMIHVILAMLGISILLQTYPQLFAIIRYSGAAYLFYLGTSYLVASSKNKQQQINNLSIKNTNSEALISGFIIDLFNPFVSIFYLSLFSLINITNKPIFELSGYFAIIFFITIAWFSFVIRFFTVPIVKNYFQSKSRYIQIASGIAMYYFCFSLL